MNKTGNSSALFMTQVDFEKMMKVLSLATGRAILRIITHQSKTVKEIHKELGEKGQKIKYRESVYKALERMVAIGLAEKIYEKRIVRYKSKYSKIEVDLLSEKTKLS